MLAALPEAAIASYSRLACSASCTRFSVVPCSCCVPVPAWVAAAVSWSMKVCASVLLSFWSPSVSMAENRACAASCALLLPARRSASETVPSSLVSSGS